MNPRIKLSLVKRYDGYIFHRNWLIAQLLHFAHVGEYAIYDHNGNGISYFHLIN